MQERQSEEFHKNIKWHNKSAKENNMLTLCYSEVFINWLVSLLQVIRDKLGSNFKVRSPFTPVSLLLFQLLVLTKQF
jgi:hypothetical protein